MTRSSMSTPSWQSPATLLEALVRIQSNTDREQEAVAWLQAVARGDGFRVLEDEPGNFVCEAGTDGPLLWFVGHIDTVPGDFPVRVEDGVLWGRGSVDAKGPLVAAYCAAARWIGRSGLRVRIVGCVDEEGGSRGARGMERVADPEWIIVGEPNGVDSIALGYKGVVRGILRAGQARLHASHPGVGACEQVMEAWRRFLDAQPTGDGFHDVHARIIRFEGGEQGAWDNAWARFDVRIPPGITPEQMVERIRDSAAPVEVEIVETCPAATSSPRTPLAAAFRSAIRELGMEPRMKHKTATADYNLLRQWYPDVPACIYGPGDSHLDHGPEERLDLADLDTAVRVLETVFDTLAGAHA